MTSRRYRVAFWAGAVALAAACQPSGSSSSSSSGVAPPIRAGHWAYYAAEQGLSPDVSDVSADEGGNVYVAAGDAVFAKTHDADRFLRFDADSAGLSKRCNDDADMFNQTPAKPFHMCSAISVAGAAPGKALIGYEGYDWRADAAAEWAKGTGGVDVVQFDGATGKMTLTRHVLVAAPPHVICDYGHVQWVDSCTPGPGVQPLPVLQWWDYGRRLVRRVERIVVNHDPSTLMYGDAWMGGNHATFAALLANTSQRSWVDLTAGLQPPWPEAKDVWEHHHPVIDVTLPDGSISQVYGEGFALSIDPRNGVPWGSNGVRTAYIVNYGVDLSDRKFGQVPMDLWPDGNDPLPAGDAQDDFVRGLSHCADGTLWAASYTHGLARIDANTQAVTHVPLPDGDGAWSVACDWSDGSLWIGLASGGVMRRSSDGTFTKVDTSGAPAFTRLPVKNIQIDRWSKSGRVVYFAFGAEKDAKGAVLVPGGVAAYDGK